MQTSSKEEKIKIKDVLFIKKVIQYYTISGRHELPWRKNISPYRILVSEIMLQQTQVVRVLPKFSLWMKQYPTLVSLRKATLTDILILWQGLGYQRRAKALLEIASTVRTLPTSFETLCELKGIGKYTAAALLAFAYDKFEHPLLETNIRTVLIEHFYSKKKEITDIELYDVLYRLEKYPLVKKMGARVWYYALMDYGAMLKAHQISHNSKVKGYTKQTQYKGSNRELRAKIIFAIAHKKPLPYDLRNGLILVQLEKEGYITKTGETYQIS